MTEDPKLPLFDEPDHDPDVTLVVDGRRVWDALKASAATGPAAAPAPAPFESLDDAFDDDWDLGIEIVEPPAPVATVAAAPAATAPSPAATAYAPAATAPPPAATAPPPAATAPPPAATAPPPAATAPPPAPIEAEAPPTKATDALFLEADLLDEESTQSQSKIVTARPPADDSEPPEVGARVTPFGFAAIGVSEPPGPIATPATAPSTAPSTKPRSIRGPSAVEMEDQFAIGDFAGAMAIAEALLLRDPLHVDALDCFDRCRVALRASLAAKLGPLGRVPVVAVARDQLLWLTIDHKAGFILSHVDGVSSVEEIVDISGMKEIEALGILAELVEQRIIDFADTR